MCDDKTKAGGQDRELISLKEEYEVRDWRASLRCTPEQLHNAVSAVGHSAEKVREYLAGRT